MWKNVAKQISDIRRWLEAIAHNQGSILGDKERGGGGMVEEMRANLLSEATCVTNYDGVLWKCYRQKVLEAVINVYGEFLGLSL